MILSHQTVAIGKPQQFLYMLHGIFGSGRNWSSVARRLAAERPEWGIELIDLRQHGGSQGFDPPDTIAAAARDLAELAQQLGEEPAAVLGHSFGGKVALMYAREHGVRLQQVWLIDSTADASSPRGSAWQMLQLIRDAPREFEARQDLVGYLSEHGIPIAVGQWMATNLEQKDGLYRWRFDLDSVEALLHDFFREDLWSVIESPPGVVQIHVVKAKESGVLTPEAVRRLQAAARSNPRVHYHEVGGGHWVNADNPDALLELLATEL